MGFASGPVMFKRFFVGGAAPRQADQSLLDRLAQRAIGKGSVAVGDGSETGWVTGDHILDTDFTFAKNAIADCLYAALRIDANKPPSDLVRSYQKLHEQAILAQSGREFLTKQERREARDAAKNQADKEARAGRFRRMHQYAMLWDLRRRELYFGSASPAAVERFAALFKETFGHALTAATAGEMASRFAAEARLSGAYEELRPSLFVKPPEEHEQERTFTPPDESRSRDYLGTEWLMWLWYRARHEGTEETPGEGAEESLVRFEKSLHLDCAFKLTGAVSVRGDDPAHMPESLAGLASGKLPVRSGLQIVHRGEAYACAVRADVMHFSGVQLPAASEPVSPRVLFEERTARLRDFTDAVAASYQEFLRVRLSARWPRQLAAIRAWISTGGPAPAVGDDAFPDVAAAS